MTENMKMYIFVQTFTVVALVAIVVLGLFPALLAGFIIYHLTELGASLLTRAGVIRSNGKLILLGLVTVVIITAVTIGVTASASYISSGPESFSVLLQRSADIVNTARSHLPVWAQQYLPTNILEIQSTVSTWLRDNASHFSLVGKEVGVSIVHVLFGMIIGGLVAISPGFQNAEKPLAKALGERIELFNKAFRRIVFSQLRISALNTILTAIFLVGIMPALGNGLPFTKTLITVTFIVGLLPIIGNIISNTLIVLVALSVSPMAAFGCLVFLIVIHKLEYFVNAHIIGTQIRARPWEILSAMLVMEAIFGVIGVVAAPIFYAYIKDELTEQKLI